MHNPLSRVRSSRSVNKLLPCPHLKLGPLVVRNSTYFFSHICRFLRFATPPSPSLATSTFLPFPGLYGTPSAIRSGRRVHLASTGCANRGVAWGRTGFFSFSLITCTSCHVHWGSVKCFLFLKSPRFLSPIPRPFFSPFPFAHCLEIVATAGSHSTPFLRPGRRPFPAGSKVRVFQGLFFRTWPFARAVQAGCLPSERCGACFSGGHPRSVSQASPSDARAPNKSLFRDWVGSTT